MTPELIHGSLAVIGAGMGLVSVAMTGNKVGAIPAVAIVAMGASGGAVGGAFQGIVDGAVVGFTNSRKSAMIASAVTSGLFSLWPATKSFQNPYAIIGVTAVNAAIGAWIGSEIYERAAGIN